MNSKQTIKIWTRVLGETLEGKPAAEQKAVLSRLKEILEGKKKGYLLDEIIRRTSAAMARRKRLEITVAHAQSAETIDKLRKKLEKSFSEWAEVNTKVDPGIIGGFIAKTEQYILNASVKNQLDQLRKIYQN
jgi:F-type H+-transporting ATPase subunit delta